MIDSRAGFEKLLGKAEPFLRLVRDVGHRGRVISPSDRAALA